MRLHDYLRCYELDLERFKTLVCERLEPAQNEVLYVTGSLVEGLGNRYSDLDVY